MKIERINDNKIVITLSIHDLKERNLDYDSLSYNSPQAQELFWDMMHQAEVEYGFSGSDAQLFIEASHGLGGNLVITVTRVEEDGDFESIQKYIKSRFKKSDLKVRKKGKKLSSGIFIYSFDEFEDLCSVAGVITESYYGDSTLYKSGKLFYLLLTNTGIASTNPDYFDSIMSEYGKKVSNSAFIEGYLNEYGAKMIEYDALQVLKDYFK
jgi:adapter protein MecA 1/2